jgi:hypothetical protein
VGRVLFFDRWRARPGWHLASAGRCFPVSDLFRFLPLDRRRVSRVPWVSLLVRTPSSPTPPGPAHLAFGGAWVSSPLTPVTRSRPKFKDTIGMLAFSGLNSSASDSLPTLRAALSVRIRDPAQSMLRRRKARFRWRGCTPFRPGFGPGWDSSEAFLPLKSLSSSFLDTFR